MCVCVRVCVCVVCARTQVCVSVYFVLSLHLEHRALYKPSVSLLGELVGGWERACVRACVCVYIVIVKYFPCI